MLVFVLAQRLIHGVPRVLARLWLFPVCGPGRHADRKSWLEFYRGYATPPVSLPPGRAVAHKFTPLRTGFEELECGSQGRARHMVAHVGFFRAPAHVDLHV